MADIEELIRQRAYEIWREEGCPEGREQEHWQRAEAEVRAAHGGNGKARGRRAKSEDVVTPARRGPKAQARATPTPAEAAETAGLAAKARKTRETAAGSGGSIGRGKTATTRTVQTGRNPPAAKPH